MEKSKLIVPNEILMSEVARVVAGGGQARIPAKGRSMHPYVHDGTDELVVSPCDPAALRAGDFILAKTTDGIYAAHRIIKISGGMITMKGDGNMLQTELVRPVDVIGKVTQIVRGNRVIDCDKPVQRIKAAVLRAAYRSWRMATALGRRAAKKIIGKK